MTEKNNNYGEQIIALAKEIYEIAKSKGWWDAPRNDGEALALCHTEIGEGMKGLIKMCPDDKLPHHPMAVAEQADVVIRLLDWAYGKGYLEEGMSLADCLKEGITNRLLRIGVEFFNSKARKQITKAYKEQGDPILIAPIMTDITFYADAHNAIAIITESLRTEDKTATCDAIFCALCMFLYPLDIMLPVIREKMDYNKTRSYKHGKKF